MLIVVKILIFICDNLELGGGGPEVVKRIAHGMTIRGNKVTIISGDSGNRYTSELKDYLLKLKVEICEIGFLWPTTFPNRKGKALIKRIIAECDIVYFILWMGGIERYLLKMQFKFNVPIIEGHHGQPENLYVKISTLQKIYYKIYGDRTGKNVRSFAAHHVLNKEHEAILLKKNFKNIFLIGNGINIGEFKSNKIKGRVFKILYVGRLNREKGIDKIDKLIKKLFESGIDNFQIIIAGDGELRDFIISLTNKFNNVIYKGFINDDERNELYAECNCLLSLSETEAFFIAGLESLASGTPVISIENSGVKEYIEDGVNGFIVKDIGEMNNKILFLYDLYFNNYETYIGLSNRCKEFSLEYNWDTIIDKYLTMFHDTVKFFKSGENE